MKKECDLQGNLRKNSIIMCQIMITSDNKFFKKIGLEETGVKHYKIEDLKKITNFENTKKVLRNINLKLPDVSELADISKFSIKRDEIIADNKELNNRVKELENEYEGKSITLDLNFDNRKRELEKEFQEKTYNIEYEYKNKVRKLEKFKVP